MAAAAAASELFLLLQGVWMGCVHGCVPAAWGEKLTHSVQNTGGVFYFREWEIWMPFQKWSLIYAGFFFSV